jgi:hypothetical protein
MSGSSPDNLLVPDALARVNAGTRLDRSRNVMVAVTDHERASVFVIDRVTSFNFLPGPWPPIMQRMGIAHGERDA